MNTLRSTPPDFVRETDEDHLALVREMPCLVFGCWSKADPHHVISRGAGGSDLSAVPLCREHHRELHTTGQAKFEYKHNVTLWVEVANCLAARVRSLKEGK